MRQIINLEMRFYRIHGLLPRHSHQAWGHNDPVDGGIESSDRLCRAAHAVKPGEIGCDEYQLHLGELAVDPFHDWFRDILRFAHEDECACVAVGQSFGCCCS